jgi:hypothetical protein
MGTALAVLLATPAWAHGVYPYATAVDRHGDALVVSTDVGAVVSSGDHFSWICEEVVDGPAGAAARWTFSSEGTLMFTTPRGLYVSRDRGCSFTRPSEFADTGAAAIVDAAGTLFLTSAKAGTVNRVTRSRDDGRSWQVIGPASAAELYSSVVAAPSRAQRLYVGAWWYDPPFFGVYRSDDGGDTFTRLDITAQLPQGTFLVQAVHPSRPDLLFASTTEWRDPTPSHLLRSDDGGGHFKEVLTDPDGFTQVAFSTGGSRVWAASSTGLYASADDGETFTRLAQPSNYACVYVSGADRYSCAWADVDGFVVGKSSSVDGPLVAALKWNQVSAVDCPPDSPTQATCGPLLAALRSSFPPDTTLKPGDAGTRLAPVDPLRGGCDASPAPLLLGPVLGVAAAGRRFRRRKAGALLS